MNPQTFTLTPIGVDALPPAAAVAPPFVPQEDDGPAAAMMGSAAVAPFERENTNVKVSDWLLSNAELRRRAECYGKVISVNVQASKNRRTRHGFVNFVQGASAAACIEDGMSQFAGHALEPSTFRAGGSAPTPKVYIDGLPAGGMDEANVPLLRHAFEGELRFLSQALQIVSIDPPSRREVARSSCIVEFTSTPSYEVLERLRDITTLPVGARHFPVTLFVKYNQPPQPQQQQSLHQPSASRHPPPFLPLAGPGYPQVPPSTTTSPNVASFIGRGAAGHHHQHYHPHPNSSLYGAAAATAVPPQHLLRYLQTTLGHHHHHDHQATTPYFHPHPHPPPQQQQQPPYGAPYGPLFHHPHGGFPTPSVAAVDPSLQQYLASFPHAGYAQLPGASSAFPHSHHLGAAFAAQPHALLPYPPPQQAVPFAPQHPHQHPDHGAAAAGWPPVSHHPLQQQQPAAVASFYPFSP